MTGCPRRIVVQPGTSTVRLAGATPDDPPRVLAEVPAGEAPDLAGLLAELLEERPVEMTLLHPSSWAPDRATAWAQGAAGLADRVRAVPAAVTVGAAMPRVVVDAGHDGVEITLLGPDGIRAGRTRGAGGARLDEITLDLLLRSAAPGEADRTTLLREARRVRERLSLLPVATARLAGERVGLDAAELRHALAGPLNGVVDVLRALLGRTRPEEIVLVGGLARTPLLAELIDAADLAPVRVPARPDVAALLGALEAGVPAVSSGWVAAAADSAAGAAGRWITAVGNGPVRPGLPAGEHDRAAPGGASDRTVARDGPAEPAPRWLPPVAPRPRRPLRIAAAAVAGLATAAGLLAAGVLLAPPTAATGNTPPAGVLVQYGYRLDLPVGWEHTGGLPERRRTLITPAAAPDGSDLISVERTDLGYDALGEPGRALAELRAEFDAAVAHGAPLTGFDPAARVAGRLGIGYRQAMAGGAVVDWFVVLDRGVQLSVGCQHTAAGAAAVGRACAAVIGSVRRQEGPGRVPWPDGPQG